MPPEPEEEDEIISTKRARDQPHQWVIKRRQNATDTYMYVHDELFSVPIAPFA